MRLADVSSSPHFTEHTELARLADVLPSEEQARSLAGEALDRFAMAVENPEVCLTGRLAAGGALALLGDHRIDELRPAVCAVPGGTVPIGLAPEEIDAIAAAWAGVGVVRSWIEKETPVHTVELADFWMARYPVTNGEYRSFLASTGGLPRPTTWYLGAYPYDRSNHPVAGISADDADAYADWLSERSAHPWRLPTEAEWEHAAKGPDMRAYPWGDVFDPSAANTRETGIHTTSPVGAFPGGRSPFGIHDMGGNVEEFVADEYLPYPGGPYVTDHLVETMGTYRVARGGSFSRFGDLTRTRRRHGAFPGPLYPMGFRLATSEPPPTSKAGQ